MRAVESSFLCAMVSGPVFSCRRGKAGPCQQLDDLKKVVGLDDMKVDARKNRLVGM